MLLSEANGPVHRLILDRPARRNALIPELARALAAEIDQLGDAGAAHVIVLSGSGGHFSAGLDLHWLRSLGAIPAISDLQRGLSDFQSAVLAVVRCPIPVVAALRGTVAGFGLDLALACDFRIAGTGASFTSAFARMGLVPDGGSTFTLPRLSGIGHAMRFLMAGETLDSARARAIGLVDEVVDDDALDGEIDRVTRALASAAPGSLRAIKRLVRAPELGGLEQALAAEGAAQLQALQGAEFRRRLEAFAAR
ncbi:MAG: enoyl-CoA hydratase/isomerase family protein [Gemmatimonadales bacterium]|nr:enoyl-CoA hydratase/isomerase family protein [Gemmatimonadales bacterium]MBA3556823.1 enoyl-CoA hydratase/isomerase family protein [Gemmatimonadales bacterium]